MTLPTNEFIRRFLIHILPSGFHRIRHYGLFANTGRARNIARARELLCVPATPSENRDPSADPDESSALSPSCPCCGGPMVVIETFERGATPRYPTAPPMGAIRIDTS